MSGGTNWNWMRRMSHQWMNRIQVWTRDGMSLSKQLWIANDSIERRATLLSNRNNTWAISYLKVEKEINLFHYHGPIQYIQLLSNNNNNKQLLSNEKTGNNSHQSLSTAKVAFMITSTQRKELQTLLGYTKDAIKSLNPTEAQIILQHHLPPTTEGQIKLQELIMLQSSEEKKKTNNNDNDTTIGSIQDNKTNNDKHHHDIGLSNENQIDLSVTSQMTSEMSSSLVIVPKTSNDDSPIVDATLSPSNNNNNHHTTKLSHDDDDNSWYEVIQHTKFRNKETNKEMVREEAFALFRTKSEAQDCIDIKQKHATNDMDYTIRKKVFK